MPVIRSAKKKLRVDRKRESVNKKIKSLVELSIKKVERKPTTKNVQEAFSVVDKAVKNNMLHKNKAARIKSRLSKLISKKIQVSEKSTKTTKAKSSLVKVKKTKKSKK